MMIVTEQRRIGDDAISALLLLGLAAAVTTRVLIAGAGGAPPVWPSGSRCWCSSPPAG